MPLIVLADKNIIPQFSPIHAILPHYIPFVKTFYTDYGNIWSKVLCYPYLFPAFPFRTSSVLEYSVVCPSALNSG